MSSMEEAAGQIAEEVRVDHHRLVEELPSLLEGAEAERNYSMVG